jgi:hypothetical protein
MKQYYVIEIENLQPNDGEDHHRMFIQTEPGQTNMSREVRVDGWLGTTNNIREHAHGAYDSESEARLAVEALLSEDGYRECDEDISDGDNVTVAVYRVGRYAPMGAEESRDWCHDSIQELVATNPTPEQIEAALDEWEDDAHYAETPMQLNVGAVHDAIIAAMNG